MTSKKIYCGGLLCRKSDRKFKCVSCSVYICGGCEKTNNNKKHCPDCYIDNVADILGEKLILGIDDFLNTKIVKKGVKTKT